MEADAIHAFCAERAKAVEPPIVDVVADPRYRLLVEPLPLFGKVDFAGEDVGVDLDALASAVTGLRAVVRHRRPDEPPAEVGALSVEVPVPVRYFRHSGLQGSSLTLGHLLDLQRRGKTNVVLQFPPRGFKPPPRLPEIQLARVLADPRGQQEKGRRRPDGLICHFSCHQRSEGGRPYLGSGSSCASQARPKAGPRANVWSHE